MFRTTYHCPFCGVQVMTRFDEDEKAAAKAHMASCIQHPYYKLRQDSNEERKRREEADERLRENVQDMVRRVLGPHYTASSVWNAVVDLTDYARVAVDDSLTMEVGGLKREIEKLKKAKDEVTRGLLGVTKHNTEIINRNYHLRKAFSEVYHTITGKTLTEGAPWTEAVEEIKACWNKAKEVNPTAEVLRGHLLHIYKALFKRDWEEGALWSDVVNRILVAVEMREPSSSKAAANILDEVAYDLCAKASKLRGIEP